MHSLVVGMGIGKLYQNVLESTGAKVITVDQNPNLNADYLSVEQALQAHNHFDTAHICTPNFTHYELAARLANHARIVFVEKPGVENAKTWMNLHTNYPQTKFIMVKNNQWRDNIAELRELANNSKVIQLHWINQNRVPNPGSWFTTRKLAFGGVSRDLVPHLLSFVAAFETDYDQINWAVKHCYRQWRLQDLLDTEYGTVNPEGTYDVDDHANYSGVINNKFYSIEADWKSNKPTDIAIYFDGYAVPLGLCPESAYINMIDMCIRNLNNNAYWQHHLNQDIWIHNTIDFNYAS